jgi:hypothetical protein
MSLSIKALKSVWVRKRQYIMFTQQFRVQQSPPLCLTKHSKDRESSRENEIENEVEVEVEVEVEIEIEIEIETDIYIYI